MITEINYEERVAKGIALLDAKVPDWFTRVDTDTLNVASGTLCVTAQVSGKDNWLAGMRLLDLDQNAYIGHGFNIRWSDHDTDEEGAQALALLTDLWSKEITTRQQTASVRGA